MVRSHNSLIMNLELNKLDGKTTKLVYCIKMFIHSAAFQYILKVYTKIHRLLGLRKTLAEAK